MQRNFSLAEFKRVILLTIIGVLIAVYGVFEIAFGIFGYFISENEKIQQLSFGMIIFGIGLIGFSKTGLEVFENHRLDKRTTVERVSNM